MVSKLLSKIQEHSALKNPNMWILAGCAGLTWYFFKKLRHHKDLEDKAIYYFRLLARYFDWHGINFIMHCTMAESELALKVTHESYYAIAATKL